MYKDVLLQTWESYLQNLLSISFLSPFSPRDQSSWYSGLATSSISAVGEKLMVVTMFQAGLSNRVQGFLLLRLLLLVLTRQIWGWRWCSWKKGPDSIGKQRKSSASMNTNTGDKHKHRDGLQLRFFFDKWEEHKQKKRKKYKEKEKKWKGKRRKLGIFHISLERCPVPLSKSKIEVPLTHGRTACSFDYINFIYYCCFLVLLSKQRVCLAK